MSENRFSVLSGSGLHSRYEPALNQPADKSRFSMMIEKTDSGSAGEDLRFNPSERTLRIAGEWESKHLASRSENLFSQYDDYKRYKKAMRSFHGVIQKHLDEHVGTTISVELANRYAGEFPHKTMLNHFSVRGLSRQGEPTLWAELRPGHFLQGQKQEVVSATNAGARKFEISVEDREALLIYPEDNYEQVSHIHVALYPKDKNGEYDHDNARFAKIVLDDGALPDPLVIEVDGEAIDASTIGSWEIAPLLSKGVKLTPKNTDFLLYDYRQIDEVT
ncbi:MAG: hypothetical protein HWE20_10415 [Gammaproteobacteria bacterium]|nr:hypothetical protein [Gammaproteobacteria bacterium]